MKKTLQYERCLTPKMFLKDRGHQLSTLEICGPVLPPDVMSRIVPCQHHIVNVRVSDLDVPQHGVQGPGWEVAVVVAKVRGALGRGLRATIAGGAAQRQVAFRVGTDLKNINHVTRKKIVPFTNIAKIEN